MYFPPFQIPDTAAIFSPIGNMHAMISLVHVVLYTALVHIFSCLYFYLPYSCFVCVEAFLNVMLFTF